MAPASTLTFLFALWLTVTPTSDALGWGKRDSSNANGSCPTMPPSALLSSKSLRLSRIGRRTEQDFGAELECAANKDLNCCGECSHCLNFAVSKCRGGVVVPIGERRKGGTNVANCLMPIKLTTSTHRFAPHLALRSFLGKWWR